MSSTPRPGSPERARRSPRIGASGARRPEASSLTRASLAVADNAVDVARPVKNLRGQPVGMTFIRFSLAAENAAFAQTRQRLFWLCLAMASGTLALLI